MNLAESLLGASERHPELEAFPGIPYGDLLPRVRTIAGGLASTPGDRVALVLDNRLETALLYWACQWAGAVAVPLSWRLSEDELAYCIEDCGAAIVIREDEPLPDGPAHPGELDRDEREISLLLYTSGTTGPTEGRPALACGRPRGRLVAGAPARLRLARPDARRDAALPHDGDPLAARDAPRRRLLRPAAALGCGRGAPAHRGAARSRPCTSRRRSSTTSSTTRMSSRADVSSVRALGYAGAAMTSTLVRRCVDVFRPEVFVNHYGSTEIYTFTIGRDQVVEAGLRRPSGCQHAAPARRRAARSSCISARTRRSRLLEPARRRREGDRGRLVPHRRHGAPRRRTATCGSTGGSTT